MIGLIQTWKRFPVQETTLVIVTSALTIKATHNLSYWDSAIVAAARAIGCEVLYSEDMNHGQVVDGETITKPFR